nr:PASTA domain-containing protein [Corynebacterium sp. TAE3-ERU12]
MLIGSSVGDARDKAEEAGLQLDVKGDPTDDDLVITQSPRPGKTMHKDDKVSVRAA